MLFRFFGSIFYFIPFEGFAYYKFFFLVSSGFFEGDIFFEAFLLFSAVSILLKISSFLFSVL